MVLFFDIDETLIDQQKAEAAAAARFLAAYKHLLDRPYCLAEFGPLWRSLREKHAISFLEGRVSLQEQRRRRIRELFRACEECLSDAEADARFEYYQEHYRNSWSLFDDVLPCLESLAGYRLGIISNGSAEQQKRKLRQTGIERFFTVVVISEEIGAAKPHPEIFTAACRQAGCSPEESVYVGDRLDLDVRASRRAGMKAFWLNRRRDPEQADVEAIGSLTEICAKVQ
jgi:putative hydrolase of the HAD superfamily